MEVPLNQASKEKLLKNSLVTFLDVIYNRWDNLKTNLEARLEKEEIIQTIGGELFTKFPANWQFTMG